MPGPVDAVETPRYPAVMMAIHWATAALLLAVVVLAWTMPEGPAADTSVLLLLHRSIGLTILLLTALRVAVRARLHVPVQPGLIARLEDAAARVTHVLLYVVLIVMPISGFLWTTSRGRDVSVFGLFAIPPLLPTSETMHTIARMIHSFGQFAVYGVVGLHAAAALYHLILRRDGVMARMLPTSWAVHRAPSLASASRRS